MASRNLKMHGRVEGATSYCAVPGCRQVGEYKAPVEAANFDGPGAWQLLCLEHVREHNSKYDFFEGMSPEEITEAQGPFGGWERPSRRFVHSGADPAPAWSDFSDPLDAIAARFRRSGRAPQSRFSRDELRALAALGLGDDADLHSVRQRYSQLVRRYHPDRNGGARSQEKNLGAVIDAWQLLKSSRVLS